jgi:acyl carrier protein
VPGQLFISGAQLARGYRGRPALSAERFVADPFAGPGARMYASGDRVRRRADGQIEFLGRLDDQLKLRGFRIEPGEVEAVLTTHPAVRAAVLMPFGDEADRALAVFLVPADQEEGLPDEAELREWLRRQVPEYMVPAVFAELAALPLTSSGKVDRRRLPDPRQGRPAAAAALLTARTPTEQSLAGLWRELLGLEPDGEVGVRQGFFDLGGHSLLVTRLVSRIREDLGVEIAVSQVFTHPTIEELARVLDAHLVTGDTAGQDREEFEL